MPVLLKFMNLKIIDIGKGVIRKIKRVGPFTVYIDKRVGKGDPKMINKKEERKFWRKFYKGMLSKSIKEYYFGLLKRSR